MNRLHLNLALSLLLPGLCLALPEDQNQPINLEADQAQWDQKTGTSVYRGNVIISQGSMRLTADTATLYVTDGLFRRMEATGAPSTFRYKPAANKEEIQGVGEHVEYDVASAKVIVTDNARFTQGGDVFTGHRVEYDLNADVVKANSKEGGRIHITIQPKPAQGQNN